MSANLYLLDTNTVSYFVKATFPSLNSRFQQEQISDLAVSAITVSELRFWVASRPQISRVRVMVDNFLFRVQTLPWDASAAGIHGELRFKLKQIGRPIAGFDLLIAAHAIAVGATLVTHDQAFTRIPNLRTEDWVKP